MYSPQWMALTKENSRYTFEVAMNIEKRPGCVKDRRHGVGEKMLDEYIKTIYNDQ